jgi:hypothetical protein
MWWFLRAVAGLSIAIGLAILFPVWFPNPPTSSPLNPPGQSRAAEGYLSGWADERLRRRDGEDDLAFAGRLTTQVYRATYHCDAAEARQSLSASLAAARAPETSTYGYLDPSIMRCGFCHQRAFVLAEALRRGGLIDAKAFALNEHVVTLFSKEGRYYLADPDYGVGPVLYDGSTYSSIPDTHYAQIVDPATLTILKRAFTHTVDDEPYMTHEWLMALALRQGDEVRAIEAELRLWGRVLLYGGALALFALLMLPKRRSADRLTP